ncbi:hypothetical protein [Lactobacillus hominis]|uniref:Uncharacterized protein n=1 Tax=Lactobacillus hominis DSM 23910 = CRBIP 24.179 TaxID=1423758 RepID=I7L7C5_9LACO|nr:hypothetical protein [Lactobacillus hominis]CCI82547.1 Protein of unknown function [Lactobacillus hominis DSM 23910 = CRBIP 24.179]
MHNYWIDGRLGRLNATMDSCDKHLATSTWHFCHSFGSRLRDNKKS